MIINIEKYKEDLKKLISKGESLHIAMQYVCYPDELKEAFGKDANKIIKSLPDFYEGFQAWYSESKVLIKQLLPDRLDDFVAHYERPRSRKEISNESYRIVDFLQGLEITTGFEKRKVVGVDAAIPQFRQQLGILKAVQTRFESSLFDIRQIVQADLLDSEISEARELLKNGFIRASGAIAGVVLEKHFAQVVQNHNISIRKKNPSISDYNDLLKKEVILDTPSWRQVQRLGDIRNLCDHNKERDPSKEEAQELIDGVEKYVKTLF